jgi:mannitol/fructose-specific phosphotransferase system IIA component (Ntr-type)
VKIHKSISTGDVHLDLDADDLESALESVAEKVADDIGVPSDTVVRALLERERLGSTSVGDGFAIPHCKLPGIKTIKIALARFNDGIPFAAPDNTPVSFVFIVLSPPDQPAAHLQVLSQIARVLKRKELRSELLQAPDSDAVVDAVGRVAETEGL